MSSVRSLVPCDACSDLFINPDSRNQVLSQTGFTYRRIRLELETAADVGCPLCEYLVRQDLKYPWIWPKNFHYELRKFHGSRPASYPRADEELLYCVRAKPAGCTHILISAISGVDFGNMNVVFLAFTPYGMLIFDILGVISSV